MKFSLHLIILVIPFIIEQTTQVAILIIKQQPFAPKHTVNTVSDRAEHQRIPLKSRDRNGISADTQQIPRKRSNTENNTKLTQVMRIGYSNIHKYIKNKPSKQTDNPYRYIDENNNVYGSVKIYNYNNNCKINVGGFVYYLQEDESGNRYCEEELRQVDEHPKYVIVNGIRYYRPPKPKPTRPPKKHPTKNRPTDKYCSGDHPPNKNSANCNPFKIIKEWKPQIFNNIIKTFKQHNIFG